MARRPRPRTRPRTGLRTLPSGPAHSIGTDLLRDYLETRGIPASAVAKACGWKRPSTIQGWLNGRCRPGAARRVKLAEVTGIAPNLWDMPSTKKTTES